MKVCMDAGKETPVDAVLSGLRRYHVGCLVLEQLDPSDFSGKERDRIMRLLLGLMQSESVSVMILCSEQRVEERLGNPQRAMPLTSANDLHYLPYSKGEEWDRFMKELWKLQWVQNPAEREIETQDILYRWSGGIAEIVLRGWISVQEKALCEGRESWNSADLNQALRESLQNVQPYLTAVDEVHPQEIEAALDGVHI